MCDKSADINEKMLGKVVYNLIEPDLAPLEQIFDPKKRICIDYLTCFP